MTLRRICFQPDDNRVCELSDRCRSQTRGCHYALEDGQRVGNTHNVCHARRPYCLADSVKVVPVNKEIYGIVLSGAWVSKNCQRRSHPHTRKKSHSLQPQLRRRVLTEQGILANVAPHHGQALVAGLLHDTASARAQCPLFELLPTAKSGNDPALMPPAPPVGDHVFGVLTQRTRIQVRKVADKG